MTRHLVVVDTETNGLDPEHHEPVEVAWWNLTTDVRGHFITAHDVHKVLWKADVKALQVNRYVDRIADRVPHSHHTETYDLHDQLKGNTLAGSNPAFDAVMLRKLQDLASSPWHYRLFDLSAYAAGALGLDELPGLATVCELLNIEPGDHTAEADVTATGLCIRALQARAKRNAAVTVSYTPA